MSPVIIRRVLATLVLGVASLLAFAQDRPGSSASSGDARFLQLAAAHALAEIELGRLAQEKGVSDQVRQLGSRMVADHTKDNEKLMEMAAARRVQLPTEIDRKHQQALERLGKLVGPEFDRAYARQMVDDHRDDLKLYRRMAESGKDPELREFAAKAASVLQAHLRAAQATRDVVMAGKRTGERETGSNKN